VHKFATSKESGDTGHQVEEEYEEQEEEEHQIKEEEVVEGNMDRSTMSRLSNDTGP